MADLSLCCPKCAAVLKIPGRPAEGKKVRCPKCGVIFVAKDNEKKDGADAVTSRPDRLGIPPALKGPRTRGDEEELPRNQKKRPSKMEEDETPRRGNARRHADEEDDPPRQKKARKGGSNAGLITGLCIGGGVVALAGVVGVGLWWWLASSPARPQPVAQTSDRQAVEQKPIGGPGGPGGQPANRPGVGEKPQAGRQPMGKPDPAPPGQRQPQPVAGPVDLDRAVLDRITRATTLVRVDLGNQGSSGSGFLVKSSGDTAYIITNFHVIAMEKEAPAAQPQAPRGPRGRFGRIPIVRPPRPPRFFNRGPFGRGPFGQPSPEPKAQPRVMVVLHSGTPEEQTLSAEVVAVDQEADLAALRVTGARNLPSVIDVSQEATVAETRPVYIFGFPRNPAQVKPGNPPITVGKGTIAGLRRDANNELIDVHINGIINPGNSGGPVVDAQGRLVGIAVATVPGKQIGFAIPAGELQQMFKGRLSAGFVVRLKHQGAGLVAIGETWVHDRKNSVRSRDVLSVPLQNSPKGQRIPVNEFFVLARLADPMLKIKTANACYAVTEDVPAQPGAAGWAQLAGATPVPLKIQDQLAIGSFKLPADAILDQTYAIQFSFVNADGKTVFTQAHRVRLTFPKDIESVTINVAGIPDEPTGRYIEETAPGAFGAKVKVKSRSADTLSLEVTPVPDAKVIPPQIKFGTVKSVKGRTFEVQARKMELPLPDDADVTATLEELKVTDERRRIAAADRLGKVYVSLPARRAEVARALEPYVTSKNIWLGNAALRGLMIWGGPENIPGLSAATENNFTRGQALHCLARFKNPAAAAALAKWLPSLGDRAFVAGALKAMGPLAEKVVIPYVKNKDIFTAQEACKILQEIGTAECIPVLTEVANGTNGFVKGHARTALATVQGRIKRGM
jgi:S1-C subfamily serine protease